VTPRNPDFCLALKLTQYSGPWFYLRPRPSSASYPRPPSKSSAFCPRPLRTSASNPLRRSSPLPRFDPQSWINFYALLTRHHLVALIPRCSADPRVLQLRPQLQISLFLSLRGMRSGLELTAHLWVQRNVTRAGRGTEFYPGEDGEAWSQVDPCKPPRDGARIELHEGCATRDWIQVR
jgi:hypothetical protein